MEAMAHLQTAGTGGDSQTRGGKYLTFALSRGEYGLGILKVKEIIGMIPITSVPQTPAFIKGVINLRGKVIPVIDLRTKFGMAAAEETERTCIIVVEAQTGNARKCWEAKNCLQTQCPAYQNKDLRCWMISGTHCRNEIQGTFYEKIEACQKCEIYQSGYRQKTLFTVGIVVDSVSEVLNIKPGDIEDPPAFGAKLNTDYILGIAKTNGGVKILLDIDRILTNKEMVLLDEIG